jgi:hypothetical protein
MGNDEITNTDSQPENEKSSVQSDQKLPKNPIAIFNSLYNKVLANKKLFAILRITLISLISLLIALFFITFILYLVPGLQEVLSDGKTRTTSNQKLKQDPNFKKQIGLLTKDIQRLQRNTIHIHPDYHILSSIPPITGFFFTGIKSSSEKDSAVQVA